jgi:hypothetical protein
MRSEVLAVHLPSENPSVPPHFLSWQHDHCPPHPPTVLTSYVAIELPLTLAILAAACSVDPGSTPSIGTSGGPVEPGPTPSSSVPSSSVSSESTTSTAGSQPSSGVTPIRVIVGGQTLTAELYDNPTAHDLPDQLPLTVTLADLHQLEKTGPLPRALTTDGVPGGADPEVNEIGYYAPGNNLVFYYGDVGYFSGIIRIGRFDTEIDFIRDQPDGFSVTVERA